MIDEMRAAVDIGSNTVRLLIGRVVELSQTGEGTPKSARAIEVLEQQLFTTRLGQTKSGAALAEAAVQRTLAALVEFKKTLAKYQVAAAPVVAATSAVREASNQREFAAAVKNCLGWDLQILAGETEARLAYLGASSVVGSQPVVIDVGGGSTEMIWQTAAGLAGSSQKVGAVRLFKQEFTKADLPTLLKPLVVAMPKDREFVGVGGTITTLGAMKKQLATYSREAINGITLSQAEIKNFHRQLSALSPSQRLAKYPLLQNREDIILAGIEIYLVLMDLAGIKQIIISDAGLLDGLLLAEI